ncbi:MAG TPA: hypothetical protein VJ548_14615 [Azospira sp.]|nr:hypothetical protein [Azospira sp.]
MTEPNKPKPAVTSDNAGTPLAIAAESLFLVNLMLAPGLGFLALAWLWRKHRHSAPLLARQHLEQTFWVSFWGGLLLVVVCATLIVLGGLHWEWTWVAVILYFTCIHSTLIMGGMLGLARAMAGRPWRFPLIGPRLAQ